MFTCKHALVQPRSSEIHAKKKMQYKNLFSLFLLCCLCFVLIRALWQARRKSRLLKSYVQLVKSKYPELPATGEVSERAAVLEHIRPHDVVLEIGANIGGVSSLLASVLESPRTLVSVDPLAANCQYLTELGKSIEKPFHVFHGVVKGPIGIECLGENKVGAYCKCEPSDSPTTENLTILDIEDRYKLNFTALVIDCEGCYESLMPQILNVSSLKQIQIEWDGTFMEKDILNAGYSLIATYYHQYLKNGVRVYKRE